MPPNFMFKEGVVHKDTDHSLEGFPLPLFPLKEGDAINDTPS